MIGECLEKGTEFGVIQATNNSVVNTGCTASVDQVLNHYADGRLDILTVGSRRFEVLRLNEDLPYLRGAVEFYDDDEPESDIPQEVRRRAMELYELFAKATGEDNLPTADEDDPQLSFRIAQPIDDLAFRQSLLNMKSEAARLRRIIEFVPGYTDRRQQITHIKEVAPRNGHGTWPSNL